MHLYGSMKINQNGHLEIGGCDSLKLAEKYGTPLIVYDVSLIRNRARSFLNAFKQLNINGHVAYASKAFSSVAIFQLINEEGLSLDVVSGGELYTAIKAHIPPKKIHFHGNNKSDEEMEMALDYGIGYFVVDNFHELNRLQSFCQKRGIRQEVLLRMTPGVEAHTHDYILTGQEDSKFGFDLQNGQAEKALELALTQPNLEVKGIHCHIGSQIFETDGFIMAIQKIFTYIERWKEHFSFIPEIVNVGGGFGIRYTDEDQPLEPYKYIEAIGKEIIRQANRIQVPIPEIWIEPGRSLVGDAGTTFYKIGSRKEIHGVRTYISVDGGMSDNIRPALYDAKYEAVVANKMLELPKETVSIAGKACESGDMLIWDISLPQTKAGDLLAVFCTGAYGYSMASNYNRLPRPAVVFVEDGKSQLAIKRESYEDLMKLDVPLYETVK
ncbi:diaminopimelate decarboxylase [Fervidibacillus halotolerans]|uniref:Diaminopimelate decarboxylase n=1 Tax=Fervidibacillus halotolerans TaxID=2980027 RepID=A0A9E8M3B5_9BACI|nr:diaminopimelate decarboxylase [Fervidibacillus halotolerans]WAA13811.1 diaminopimelate decarboxylase [Fervidibacillus halotolerans]